LPNHSGVWIAAIRITRASARMRIGPVQNS
jgi:hypothetical protein